MVGKVGKSGTNRHYRGLQIPGITDVEDEDEDDDVLTEIPEAPAGLSEAGKAEWTALAEEAINLGVLASSDLRALRLLVESLEDVATLRTVIAAEGVLIAGGTGPKAHPAVRSLSEARAAAMRLLADFGLSPRGRQLIER